MFIVPPEKVISPLKKRPVIVLVVLSLSNAGKKVKQLIFVFMAPVLIRLEKGSFAKEVTKSQEVQTAEVIDITAANSLSFIINLKEAVTQCRHIASSAALAFTGALVSFIAIHGPRHRRVSGSNTFWRRSYAVKRVG